MHRAFAVSEYTEDTRFAVSISQIIAYFIQNFINKMWLIILSGVLSIVMCYKRGAIYSWAYKEGEL